MRNRFFKIIFAFIAVLLLLQVPARAAKGDLPIYSPVWEDGCSADIIYEYGEEKTPIEGTVFSLYRVYALNPEKASTYTLDPRFDELEMDNVAFYRDLNLRRNLRQAQQFIEHLGYYPEIEPDFVVTTDANGRAHIDVPRELAGVFLLLQTGTNGGNADRFETLEPSIIQIPQVGDDRESWVKNSVIRPKPQPTEKPIPVSVLVKKVWDDADDQDKIRPEDVEIMLYIDGKRSGDTVILSEKNGWADKFTNLPMHKEDGTAYVYTVSEISVPSGYRAAVVLEGEGLDSEGAYCYRYTVTNSHIPETTPPETTPPETTPPGSTSPPETTRPTSPPQILGIEGSNLAVYLLIGFGIVGIGAVIIIILAAKRRKKDEEETRE